VFYERVFDGWKILRLCIIVHNNKESKNWVLIYDIEEKFSSFLLHIDIEKLKTTFSFLNNIIFLSLNFLVARLHLASVICYRSHEKGNK
jgi:hypothetical protein